MSETTLKGKVRVFACGGAGTNIAYQLEATRGKLEAGFAQLEITYIDTSRSNLIDKKIDDSHTFLLEGLDGSGGVRKTNYTTIAENIKKILIEHPAQDLNIILSSGGGGSGSVIAPTLASELISKDIPTIIFLVGSSDTRKDIENTINTMKSYDGIRNARNAPVVVYYEENSKETPKPVVDKNIYSAIISLLVLYSRENKALDSQDLKNWLRFDNGVTSFEAQVAGMKIVSSAADLTAYGNVISVATLNVEGKEEALDVTPDYQCDGFVSQEIDERVVSSLPRHFVTIEGYIAQHANALQKKLKALEEAQAARKAHQNILSSNDNVTDNGIVL